jgi:hypothetical protein
MKFLMTEKFDVYRRASQGRDALNNPSYGHPIDGDGWRLIYLAMPCRLALTDKHIEFARGGERVQPQGTMYVPATFDVREEDRVISPETPSVTYVVVGVRKAYKTSRVVSHLELIVALP